MRSIAVRYAGCAKRVEPVARWHWSLSWVLFASLCCLVDVVWAQDADRDSIATAASDASMADSLMRQAAADTPEEMTEALSLLNRMSAAMDSLLVIEQEIYAATDERRELLRVKAEREIRIKSDVAIAGSRNPYEVTVPKDTKPTDAPPTIPT